MIFSQKKKDEAYNILKNYDGNNPYILILKRDIYVKNNQLSLSDFQIEYILYNYNFLPIKINRITKIAKWYGEKKQIDWNLDFIPEKLKVISLLGETSTTYHCYVQYRKSISPVQAFLPKKAVLKNFLYEDYHNVEIDFDKYDKITLAKDCNRKIKEHQKEAIKFLVSRKKCLLADEMGYGKTTELIVGALESNFDKILIICPASIKTNWKKELMWYVNEQEITIIDSINEKNKNELEEHLGYNNSGLKKDELVIKAKELGKWKSNKFVIINFDIIDEFYKIPSSRSKESILNAYNNSPMLQFVQDGNNLLIIDEVHKLSNTTSNRYKIIKDLIKRANFNGIYLATGTPITNKPINFYNVLSFLNDPITDDWQYYVQRYCNGFQIPAMGEKDKWTNKFLHLKNKKYNNLSDDDKIDLKNYIKENAKHIWVTGGSSNLDELEQRVSHIYLRREKDDIMGDIKKTIHEVHHKLTVSQKNEYEKLWEEYEAAQMENDPNKELNKDLIEDALYRKYISDIMVPHTIELVNNLIKDGSKVIIGCCYDDELYSLQEYYKDICVIYNGKMSAKQKDKSEKKFMTDDNVKVFIGNINAAGVGINLVAANKLVFNNMSFVPGDNKQFEDRIFRIGQNKNVDIYYQLFDDTQYEHIWNLVLKKSYIIDQIIKKESEK